LLLRRENLNPPESQSAGKGEGHDFKAPSFHKHRVLYPSPMKSIPRPITQLFFNSCFVLVSLRQICESIRNRLSGRRELGLDSELPPQPKTDCET
jgi:hypothetical protein